MPPSRSTRPREHRHAHLTPPYTPCSTIFNSPAARPVEKVKVRWHRPARLLLPLTTYRYRQGFGARAVFLRDPAFFACTVHRLLLTPGTRTRKRRACKLLRFRRSQIQYTCTVRAWRRSWSAIGHEQWITWYRPMPPRRRHGGREARIIAAGWWRGIAAAKLARLLRSRGPPPCLGRPPRLFWFWSSLGGG